MIPRVIEINGLSLAREEMNLIGADRIGINLMAPKAVSRALKIKSVRPTVANIIKQEMLALGGEAATAAGAIDHSVKETDVLIFGTLKQLYLLVKKLKNHYFKLPQIGAEIERVLENYDGQPSHLRTGPRTFDFGRKTYIMGILNVTPDSFSEQGKYFDTKAAIARAEEMFEEGADMIDIGGESTRPGASPVAPAEELRRVIPVIKALSKNRKIVISVDTRKAAVARAALSAGADMVNDVSGLRFDKQMAKLVAEYKVPVCIMHLRGTPRTMQKKPVYTDLMGEIIKYLEESIAIGINAGILLKKIIVDPGIGFGKTVAHNLEIIKRLRELKVLGHPILIGPSRKSVIGKVLGLPAEERVEGTAAMVAVSIANGADIVRVHDVRKMVRVARMTDALVRRER